MKYRKKPVVIESIEFDGNLHSVNLMSLAWPEFAKHARWHQFPEFFSLIITTLEGDHSAKPGDYIIKGVKGEFYPCKPDIFEMTYEKLGPTDSGGEK